MIYDTHKMSKYNAQILKVMNPTYFMLIAQVSLRTRTIWAQNLAPRGPDTVQVPGATIPNPCDPKGPLPKPMKPIT